MLKLVFLDVEQKQLGLAVLNRHIDKIKRATQNNTDDNGNKEGVKAVYLAD